MIMCMSKQFLPKLRRATALTLCALALSAGAARAADVTVFAAASLKTALDNALSAFHAATGVETAVSYAGSSVLARQIQLGAPADIFISANSDWMDVLEQDGLLADGTRRDLLGNRLVVIGHGPAALLPDLKDLPEQLGRARLAMALVTAVPAGIYGKAALDSIGIWDGLAPQVAQTDNVRAALALVASGEAPFGIVYATDARAEPKVRVVAEIPVHLHPPIVYPIARIERDGQASLPLYDFLTSPNAAPHFAEQGFAVLPD
jgi:molybdate transport system substrate-binding protein